MCWQHLKAQKGLRIKPSEIANAGFGLFASKRIPKGKVIAPYTGEVLTRAQVDQRYPGDVTGQYVLCTSRTRCIDGRKSTAGAARFANSARGSTKKNNAKLTAAGNLAARQAIQANKEILTSYGKDYWKGS